MRSITSDRDEGLGRMQVGPGSPYAAHLAVRQSKPHVLTVPILPREHLLELATEPRMKRMQDPETNRHTLGVRCSW